MLFVIPLYSIVCLYFIPTYNRNTTVQYSTYIIKLNIININFHIPRRLVIIFDQTNAGIPRPVLFTINTTTYIPLHFHKKYCESQNTHTFTYIHISLGAATVALIYNFDFEKRTKSVAWYKDDIKGIGPKIPLHSSFYKNNIIMSHDLCYLQYSDSQQKQQAI